MVRILGNSPERIEIRDLQDVVYYRQIKEFTDQQYELSKDLKREIDKGRLIKIDKNEIYRGSGEISVHQIVESNNSLSISDLKTAIREVLPEMKGNNGATEKSVKDAVREVIPVLVEMVRQEVSKVSVVREEVKPKKTTTSSEFLFPTYTPSISDTGLKSNIKIKEKEVSGDSVADSLAILRQIKKK